MDIKEIAEKIVGGENVDELVKDFTPEQKLELEQAALERSRQLRQAELEAVSALRKEKQRLEGKTEDATKQLTEKLRQEQYDKAEKRLIEQFKVDPAEVEKLREAFKIADTGKFDADLIFEDLKKSYVFVNADTLLKDSQRKSELEKNAAEFMAGAAGGSSGDGGAGGSGKNYDPAVLDFVREAQKRGVSMTPEEAERGLGYKPWIRG